MTVTIVNVVRTIPERQISMYPIVLAIVLPPQFLWFKIQCLFDFFVYSYGSSHISNHMEMLLGNLCIMLLFALMAPGFVDWNRYISTKP